MRFEPKGADSRIESAAAGRNADFHAIRHGKKQIFHLLHLFHLLQSLEIWAKAQFMGYCMQTINQSSNVQPPALSPGDREMVRAAHRCVMAAVEQSDGVSLTVATVSGDQPTVALPPAAVRAIGQLLGALSEGKTMALLPAARELTTVEAANFLNVSRPFLIKEVEAGRLPHRKVGSHRRIALEDVLAYGQKMRERQEKALERMADNARELGLDY